MKFFYGSDLHLEFYETLNFPFEIPKGDLLILAGDVYLPWEYFGGHKEVVDSFFSQVTENFSKVVFVPGNHEFYHGMFYSTENRIKKQLDEFGITVLQNESMNYHGVDIFGSTLWTDMKKSHPEVMFDANRFMNDYRNIFVVPDEDEFAYKVKLRSEDTVNENFYAKAALVDFMKKRGRDSIVVTHHAPFEICIEPEYRNDNLSFCYANTGIDMFLFEDGPKSVFIHGHMHKRTKNFVDGNLILCNACGYNGHEDVRSFKFESINIGM